MKNREKILWVTNAFGCGGAERQMLYMYDILKRYSKYDIHVLYYAHVKDELEINHINSCFVNKAEIGRIRTIKAISKYIKDNDISIMHAFGGCSANIYGRAGALFAHNCIPIGAVLGKKHFASFGSRIINSFLNVFGNWWTVNNKELIPILKRDLCFVDDNHIRMIHNGFLPETEINYCKELITEYDKEKGNDFIFCSVGRLQPVKNYKLLINAALELSKKYTNVKFWIIGNGEEYEMLNNLIIDLGLDKVVKLWGYRNDIDIALDRCDAFVQTSFTEGSPNTIAEAMRASKPIISTKSTDLSEMIINGTNGYIVNNDDLDDLVNAMKRIIDLSESERMEFGSESLKLFHKYFLGNIVAREFDVLYSQVLK